MKSNQTEIRLACAADAEAIALVHVEASRTTYANILPTGYLAELSVEERSREWHSFLADSASDRFAYVAVDVEAGIVGFASGGPERGEVPEFSGELLFIYLLAPAQRAGLGRRLVSAVARRLFDMGHRSMMVWVLAENPSRRFYEAMGGTYATEKVIDLGGKSLVEVAYGWSDLGTHL